MTVCAGVVTYNRKQLLLRCLDAIERQTHPVDSIVVVDNASTDGTPEALRDRDVRHLRLKRNGGGAEGFHYAVRTGIDSGADWIWLMDDDCAPEPDALERLLAAPQAADPGTALLAPLVVMPGGVPLPLTRGWVRRRWFLTPLMGLEPDDWQRDATEVEHVSLVGPLVRREAAELAGPPRRELFIWWDDLEWVSRLRRHGRAWLIPAARIVHREPNPMPSTSFRARLRDYLAPRDFESAGWKQAYGLRNMIFCGRRDGFLTGPRAAALAAVSIVRSPRAAPTLARYALDGWRGRFRNVPPADWPRRRDAPELGYDTEAT